jgi:hypothetical protein
MDRKLLNEELYFILERNRPAVLLGGEVKEDDVVWTYGTVHSGDGINTYRTLLRNHKKKKTYME